MVSLVLLLNTLYAIFSLHYSFAYVTQKQEQLTTRSPKMLTRPPDLRTWSYEERALSLKEIFASRLVSSREGNKNAKRQCICPDDEEDDDEEILLEGSLETIFAMMGSFWSLSSSTAVSTEAIVVREATVVANRNRLLNYE
jgi:hypothetical protein